MAQTGGDILVENLIDWGIDVIFGLPGDGINGVMEALRKRQQQIRFVQVRHEEAAAFMACGYAKFTGRLGVCLATSGPGGIHLLNGLYDAKMDSVPVLAITGAHYSDLTGTRAQQDVQLDRLFMDVSVYNQVIMNPAHIDNVVGLACRMALSQRGVAHLSIPIDYQTSEIEHRSERNIPGHTSDIYSERAHLPRREDLQAAADLLNQGTKVVMLVGQGALGMDEELEQLAETLGAPIIKALLGKAAVSDHSPYTTGGIGLLGTKPSQEAMEECDTLLIIGSAFPYIEYYPKPGQARCVQVDINPSRIALRYPVDVGLVGASKVTVQELLPLLKRNESRSFLEKARAGMQEWWQLMDVRASNHDTPMKPQLVATELARRIPDNAIITSDSGTITTWFARNMPIKRGQMCSLSGNLATMACGLPYANAAQVAYPDRPVFAFVGDGGFSMLMAEFATAVKYQLPIRVLIFKNNTLGQIKWEQMVFLGNPEYEVALQPIDFAGVARACGGTGLSITDPETCGQILDQALSTPGPVVIEATVDPFEAPMPGKVTVEQATHFAMSLMRGEPNRTKIALTQVSDRVRELV